MDIPLSFTIKVTALHKYASASSLSKSSKFLILQFLVKCCKLHSVFKILSKSHVLDIFLISSVHYKLSYKLWFHSLKVFLPLIYTSIELTCGTLIIKTKNSICACSIVSMVFIYTSNKPFMLCPDNQLRKKLNLYMLLRANKYILCKNRIRIQNMS